MNGCVVLNDRKTGGIPFPNKVRVDHYFSKPIFPHFEEKIRKWIDQRNIYTRCKIIENTIITEIKHSNRPIIVLVISWDDKAIALCSIQYI